MTLLIILVMVGLSYALTFKDDFPVILVKRTVIFLIIFMVVLNLGKTLRVLLR